MGVARTAVSAFVLRRTYSLACLLLHVAVSRSGYLGTRRSYPRRKRGCVKENARDISRELNEGPRGYEGRGRERIPAYIDRTCVISSIIATRVAIGSCRIAIVSLGGTYIRGPRVIVSRSRQCPACVLPFPPFSLFRSNHLWYELMRTRMHGSTFYDTILWHDFMNCRQHSLRACNYISFLRTIISDL